MKRLTLLLLALALLSSPVAAQKKHKDRGWQDGKVLDLNSEGFTTYGGTTTTGRVNDDGTYSGSSSRASWNHKRYAFAIEGEKMIYVASHTISFRWSKEVQLTVNGPVKYAVVKNNLYLIDENDREFKLKIDKKILKE